MKMNTNLCLLPQADVSKIIHDQEITSAEDRLSNAIKGYEEANVFVNGCKSRAALVRKRRAELKELRERQYKFDAWSILIDAGYAKFPISGLFLDDFSDRWFGECRSIRQQAIEWLECRGYTRIEDGVGYRYELQT